MTELRNGEGGGREGERGGGGEKGMEGQKLGRQQSNPSPFPKPHTKTKTL